MHFSSGLREAIQFPSLQQGSKRVLYRPSAGSHLVEPTANNNNNLLTLPCLQVFEPLVVLGGIGLGLAAYALKLT